MEAFFASCHCLSDTCIDWNLLAWNAIERNNLNMFVVLTGPCNLSGIVESEAFVHSPHGDTDGLKVFFVQQISLLFLRFGNDQEMIFPHRKLIEQEAMLGSQIVFNADPGLKGLQEDICLLQGWAGSPLAAAALLGTP